jgi:apolipoprotein D and lipocalin family protein
MKTLIIILSTVAATQFAFAQEKSMPELKVVPSVDLPKYMGMWYEIARLPNKFQKHCTGDVTATYTLDEGGIEVVNRCRKQNGEISEAKGRARRASDDEPNSKLEVRFAPAVLSWLPFVWGNYWIIDLATDYSYAVVGEPSRKYLWILARTRILDASTLNGILTRIRQQGYDTGQLVMTNQSP